MSNNCFLTIVFALVALLIGTIGCSTAPPAPQGPEPDTAAEAQAEEAEAPAEPAAGQEEGEPYKIGLLFSVTGPASSCSASNRKTPRLTSGVANVGGACPTNREYVKTVP